MYAKLFSRIAQSSLMEEDVKTRYIFMMLLALADSHGDVIGTDVAIARMMNISKNEFVEGAQRLMQPDADSNSPAYDGRRIILSEAGRGYKLVNYLNYRAIKSDDEKREYMREYMKKRRASSRQLEENVKSVKLCKYQLTDVTHTEAEADTEEYNNKLLMSVSTDESNSENPLMPLWKTFNSKSRERSSLKQLEAEWKKTQDKPDIAGLIESVKIWNDSSEWIKKNRQFSPGAHLFIKNRKWETTPEKAKPEDLGKRSTHEIFKPLDQNAPTSGKRDTHEVFRDEAGNILNGTGRRSIHETFTDDGNGTVQNGRRSTTEYI